MLIDILKMSLPAIVVEVYCSALCASAKLLYIHQTVQILPYFCLMHHYFLIIITECAHEHEIMRVLPIDFFNLVKISRIVVKVFTQNFITIDMEVPFG